MLYKKIPNAPRPSNTLPPAPTKESHVIDGVIGYASQQIVSKIFGSSPSVTTQNLSSATPTITYEINIVQFVKGKSQQPRSKNKGKGNKKKDNSS